MNRLRTRELGLTIGDLSPGPANAITDVAGVRVGHTTIVRGHGHLARQQAVSRPADQSVTGPVRTGVTIILPHGGNLFRHKVRAAVHTINGFGKPLGFEEIRERGLLESPIALTNTLNVGLVADALVEHAIRTTPEIGISTGSVNVVVGETNDSYLNDIQGRHVRAEHVWTAIAGSTPGPVQEGAVGAGTGTSCFGWKGGMGSASRVVPPERGGFTVGALVQSNFGRPADLVIDGVPIGRHIQPPASSVSVSPPQEQGSIMIVLATDAPLTARQLHRLCVRAAFGLARTGSRASAGSGDFVIAFSTAHHIEHWPPALLRVEAALADEPSAMNWLFPAVIESVEESILNSLFTAETMAGRDGHVRHALPVDQVLDLLQQERPASPKTTPV